jgi:hypothetical protein
LELQQGPVRQVFYGIGSHWDRASSDRRGLEVAAWRLEAAAWRLEVRGWRLKARSSEYRLDAGGWRFGGWRLEVWRLEVLRQES